MSKEFGCDNPEFRLEIQKTDLTKMNLWFQFFHNCFDAKKNNLFRKKKFLDTCHIMKPFMIFCPIAECSGENE